MFENLNKYIQDKIKKYGRSKFSVESGIPLSTLTGMKQKKTLPSLETFKKICEFFSEDANKLLDLNPPDEIIILKDTRLVVENKTISGDDKVVFVDVLSNKTKLKTSEDIIKKEVKSKVPIFERFLSPYTSYKIRAIEIVGDYMIDMGLNDGDLCFFICGEIRGNNLYALSYRGELSIKRVVFDSFSKKIILKSENKKFNYPDLTLDENDSNLVILGKVKCWVHGYSY